MQPIMVYVLDHDVTFLRSVCGFLTDYLRSVPAFSFEIKSFQAPAELLFSAKEETVQLLITDISLAPFFGTGIDVAHALRMLQPECRTIFLSSQIAYALEVFDTDPLYFILKDEYPERLPRAIACFLRHLSAQNQYIQVIAESKTVTVPLNQLLYCEHSNRTTQLVLTDNRILCYASINRLHKQLPSDRFVICHKSYLVNLQYVHSYSRHTLTLTDGTEIPISRSCWDAFRENYQHWVSTYAWS